MTRRWRPFSCVPVSPCQKLPSPYVHVPQTAFDPHWKLSTTRLGRLYLTRRPLPDWSWLKASLPSSLGGLNLRRAALHAPAAYISSLHRSEPLISDIYSRPFTITSCFASLLHQGPWYGSLDARLVLSAEL